MCKSLVRVLHAILAFEQARDLLDHKQSSCLVSRTPGMTQARTSKIVQSWEDTHLFPPYFINNVRKILDKVLQEVLLT